MRPAQEPDACAKAAARRGRYCQNKYAAVDNVQPSSGLHRPTSIRVSLLRDLSDLDIPDSAQPTKRRAVDEPDWLKWKLVGVFPFKCQDDRCNFSEPCYLTVDMKHFRLEKGGAKNRHPQLIFRKCQCLYQCQLGPVAREGGDLANADGSTGRSFFARFPPGYYDDQKAMENNRRAWGLSLGS